MEICLSTYIWGIILKLSAMCFYSIFTDAVELNCWYTVTVEPVGRSDKNNF